MVGEPKVEAAKKRLLDLNPELRFAPITSC